MIMKSEAKNDSSNTESINKILNYLEDNKELNSSYCQKIIKCIEDQINYPTVLLENVLHHCNLTKVVCNIICHYMYTGPLHYYFFDKLRQMITIGDTISIKKLVKYYNKSTELWFMPSIDNINDIDFLINNKVNIGYNIYILKHIAKLNKLYFQLNTYKKLKADSQLNEPFCDKKELKKENNNEKIIKIKKMSKDCDSIRIKDLETNLIKDLETQNINKFSKLLQSNKKRDTFDNIFQYHCDIEYEQYNSILNSCCYFLPKRYDNNFTHISYIKKSDKTLFSKSYNYEKKLIPCVNCNKLSFYFHEDDMNNTFILSPIFFDLCPNCDLCKCFIFEKFSKLLNNNNYKGECSLNVHAAYSKEKITWAIYYPKKVSLETMRFLFPEIEKNVIFQESHKKSRQNLLKKVFCDNKHKKENKQKNFQNRSYIPLRKNYLKKI